MKKEFALVVLAAGMGSRYGGIKQLESVGQHGEVIMDYSVRDAIRAGFTKVIFILRKEIEADFWTVIGNRLKETYASDGIEISCVMQQMDDLPEGYACPTGRIKPWGTCHALLACRDVIRCPFAIINADDYYGPDSFLRIFRFLQSLPDGSAGRYCMAGFALENTLSPFGGVTRGICTVDAQDYVHRVVETRGIVCTEEGAIVCGGETLDRNSTVSMNMWGFTPDIIPTVQERFRRFLDRHADSLTAEFLLPDLIDQLLQEEQITVRQLPTSDKWHGVTYKEDIPYIREALRQLAEHP